jgi:hypothetical protein
MALSIGEFQARIGSELALLGELSSIQDYIIKDALSDLIHRVTLKVSADLSVSSATKTYSIPITIDTIYDIEDENGAPVVFSIDRNENEITLQDSAGDGLAYKVYGTPKNYRSNAAAIIAGMDEKYEAALWQWIRYRAHRQSHHEMTEQEYTHAVEDTHVLLQQINSDGTTQGMTIGIIDMQGNRVGVTGQLDGITSRYTANYQQDSYE